MRRAVWMVVSACWLVGCLDTLPPSSGQERIGDRIFEDESQGTIYQDDALPLGRERAEQTCAPLTCAMMQVQCGTTSDGCGGVLDCGGCPGGQECGRATPYVCGEVVAPRTCLPKPCGISCGLQSDGCAGVMDCGDC